MPLAVLSVIFAEVGSEHALIGGIAVGDHGRLHAAVDVVDLLVPRGKLEALAQALRARGYVAATHLRCVVAKIEQRESGSAP